MTQRNEWDVIVVGGGPAGIIAAIAAAKNKAKTLIIERNGFLGGTLTFPLPILSFLNAKGEPMVAGIPEEFVGHLKALNGCPGHFTHSVLQSYTPTDGEVVKYVAASMLSELGVDILLHTDFMKTERSGNRIGRIIVHNKSGLQSYSGRIIVDATGDADVAASSGVPVVIGRDRDGLTQAATTDFRMANVNLGETRQYLREHPEESFYPLHDLDTTYLFMGFEEIVRRGQLAGDHHIPRDYLIFHRILREDVVGINTTKVSVLAIHGDNLTHAEIECRRQMMELVPFFKKYVPGFREAYLVDSPVQIGVRETRRIVGEYVLATEDVLQGRRFPDGIARSQYPLDIHDPTNAGRGLQQIASPYEVPYRCLLPVGVDNLLVAGRCISATHQAISSARVMGTCMAMGQAAGTAAAFCSQGGISPKHLEAKTLIDLLWQQGALVGD